MRSLVSNQFRKQLEKLPAHVQEEARAGFEKWRADPKSVGWKRLNGPVCEMYSAQIGNRYRAVGVLSKEHNTVMWTFVGSHEDYNNYIKIQGPLSQKAILASHRDRLEAKPQEDRPKTRLSVGQFNSKPTETFAPSKRKPQFTR